MDNYSHSHEVDEVVTGSVHSNAFTCTLDNKLTCTLSNSGVVFDQSIFSPAPSAEDHVNFVDDVDVVSFDEPENYLTATNFQFISSEHKELARTISGLESAKIIAAIG